MALAPKALNCFVAYQLRGGREREPLFDVDKIESLTMLDESFEQPGPNFKRDDSAMVSIFAQLDVQVANEPPETTASVSAQPTRLLELTALFYSRRRRRIYRPQSGDRYDLAGRNRRRGDRESARSDPPSISKSFRSAKPWRDGRSWTTFAVPIRA